MQLRLDLDPTEPRLEPAIWTSLTAEQRRAAVMTLAKLIAVAAAAEREASDHERGR